MKFYSVVTVHHHHHLLSSTTSTVYFSCHTSPMDKEKAKFAVIFDILNPSDLISCNPISQAYLNHLIITKSSGNDHDHNHKTTSSNKPLTESAPRLQVIRHICEREVDPWCQEVYNSRNLFHSLELNPSDSKNPKQRTKREIETLSAKVSQSYTANYNKLSDKSSYLKGGSVDWRFSAVEIITIDFLENSKQSKMEASAIDTKKKTPSVSLSSEPLKARLLGYGVVRLFRSFEEDEKEVDGDLKHDEKDSTDETGTIVAIVAVPGYFTAIDLLGFIGQNTRDNITHVRLIRSITPNRYMVLMKFNEHESAERFYQQYNGKTFNSMEPETCHVIYVHSILFRSQVNHSSDFPYLLEDPFITDERKEITNSDKLIDDTRPPPPRSKALKELPTCPVCLERMDSNITGLITIACQHTFHCHCLSKWTDDSCPVCRYSTSKSKLNKLLDKTERTDEGLACSACGKTQNLWICLICGNVGCGRYDEKHAINHYTETGHCYSMDIDSQRVWDYVGDNYVHRLLQNQADGKLVEFPSPSGSNSNGNNNGDEDGNATSKKIEGISLEYTYLLTSQLESQREYYEDKLSMAVDKASEAIAFSEKMTKTLDEFEEKLDKSIHQRDEIEEKLSQLPKYMHELDKSNVRITKLRELCNVLQKQYKEEKLISTQLMEKLQFVTEESKNKDEKIGCLEEEIRDLMFHFEAQEKLANAGEEVVEGSLTVGQLPESSTNGKGKKKGAIRRKQQARR